MVERQLLYLVEDGSVKKVLADGRRPDRASDRCGIVVIRTWPIHIPWMGLFLFFILGCRVAHPPVGLPAKFTLENDHLVVQSDVKLSRNHELLKDLDRLQAEILTTLDLPDQKQLVVVYLFGDEKRYSHYLQTRYPTLPPRRAYFVGTTKELAVYTFWGDRIQEDLRHEFTHGVLHATLKDVPLWLDEGLAEYFEVTSQPTGLNREYSMNLAAGIAAGWKPDLDRLESLEMVDQMQKADYQESWAWVHFLLHHSDDTRLVLTNYLRELRSMSQPGPLSLRLRSAIPTADQRFLRHAGQLTEGVVRIGHRQGDSIDAAKDSSARDPD